MLQRLREPVSGGYAVAVLAGVAVFAVAQHWIGRPLDPIGWLGLLLVLELVIQPLCFLGHELGHAIAVVLLAKRQAIVIVGRGPWLSVNTNPVRVRFSVLPSRGVLIRGVCLYDPRGISWRSLAWIAVAGPLATFLLLVAVVAIAPHVWSDGTFVRTLVVLWAVGLLLGVIVNLSPGRAFQVRGGPAGVVMSDGDLVRHALAMSRARRPPPGEPTPQAGGRPPTPGAGAQLSLPLTSRAPERGHELEQQRDRERALTSIPPPTREA